MRHSFEASIVIRMPTGLCALACALSVGCNYLKAYARADSDQPYRECATDCELVLANGRNIEREMVDGFIDFSEIIGQGYPVNSVHTGR